MVLYGVGVIMTDQEYFDTYLKSEKYPTLKDWHHHISSRMTSIGICAERMAQIISFDTMTPYTKRELGKYLDIILRGEK